MQQNAQAEGITPKELADRNSAIFRQMDDTVLGASYDQYIRTTEPRHYKASQAI
jgi:methionyl-tRNA synthetase